MATLYALTLTWNGKDLINNLYPTLKQSCKFAGLNLQWYIRDNNSTDGTEDLIKSWNDEPSVKYYKVDHNRDSYSKCNNFLLDKIKENNTVNPLDYYLLLNNDITIVDNFSIGNMANIIRTDHQVGVVGAKLFYPGGKMIQHAGVAMSPKHGNMPWHVFTRENDTKLTNQNRYFQAVTGAFCMIRPKCIDNLQFGKMDERYNWAFDDTCLCLDVTYYQKMKVVYCGKTNIIHHESYSLSKNPANKLFMGSNVNLFRKQWGRTIKMDYFDYVNNVNYNLYQ